MLSGQVPFQSSRSFRSSDFIMQRITHGDIRFEGQQWESISPGAKDLIKGTKTILVVSLRGVNFGFWSRLGCSVQSGNILSHQGLV